MQNAWRYLANQAPSLYSKEVQWVLPQQAITGPERHDTRLLEIYDQMLCKHRSISSDEDLFRAFVTMARMQMIHFQAKTTTVLQRLSGFQLEALMGLNKNRMPSGIWSNFRNELEDFRSSCRALDRYIKRHSGAQSSNVLQELQELRDDQEEALIAAQALKTHVRDRLQIDVGKWSLEESRRSIAEGKRLKLLTMLAFIFIPISLATSVFGMNVQEINQSGTSIWAFVVTAVVLTIVTICFWGITNLLVRWRKDAI
ncbi:hypothetical protein MMC18_001274 [Xylographa bjoerkii]|nr:hypothetical protein [Xylographa bjoerkii]